MKHALILIDSDPGRRFERSQALHDEGFVVRAVADAQLGAALARQLAEENPLVLADEALTDRTGFELCFELKTDPSTWGLTVMVVAHLARALREIPSRYGPDRVIVTPISSTNLARAAKRLVHDAESTFDAPIPVPAPLRLAR